MTNNRLVAGAVAAVAGIVVGIGAVFLGGFLSAETSPSTDLNKVNANNGFVQGSVDYGSRGGAGENN
ncbi:hypothetical protein Gbro_4461 [Gordonia bronchialis DSM 43247]|jgi:hypothetical protein|uniref:DUF2613 domain-containing protein n=1 Tax=Gordonia bronchialis (strain ATCC 25592 / DSM 43247 / BCRC 13721 / JCM 3198 / KCTC 3076 / NBRC 16047 / NCTC 10667) TaxID=526226 RepID=D0L6N4_GORB4|nr:DUF2613 family protein [Gordonia bronchialis]ACY23594.1 hypothetical protein Gbro_4461 [Gordonia bronchialis DSM 43247]MCC3321763.1 DUF2613 family protein [Gordonia bronchialis]QGS23060.1 DUF2613 family protein [Gordonia bronchialis]UAK36645.1 DUF2613 family protein [Gordonia bronchialis]STQ66604.1 Protein of uncharacterised function (DUF2613) [Gordonia bronchialis]